MSKFKCRRLAGPDSPWVECNSKTHKIQAKVFDTPSKYGINRGRISKLFVRRKSDKKVVLNYDRGWDIKPKKVSTFTKPVLDFSKGN